MSPLSDYELNTWAIKSRLAKEMEILDIELGDAKDKILLDAGCNTGKYHFPEYNLRGLKVVGMDINTDYLDTSGNSDSNHNHDIHLAVGDINRLPLAPESVDIVLISEVLEHLNSPIKSLTEAHRVLKKGGYILIDVPWLNTVYRPLSAIILRTLSSFKHHSKPPLLLKIMFKNLSQIDRMETGVMLKRRPLASLLIRVLRLFPTFRMFEPEYFIYNYYHGIMPEGDMHLQFKLPGEWAETITNAGFQVIRKTGVLVTPTMLDRSRIANMLFGKVERRLRDDLVMWPSQILVIAATKS